MNTLKLLLIRGGKIMKDKIMKSSLFLLIFFLFVVKIQKSWAWEPGPLEIGLFVSERDLSLEVQQRVYTYAENPLYLGLAYFYSKKENRKVQLGKVNMLVKDFFQKEFNFGGGFQGVIGFVENNENNEQNNNPKFDIFSIGFKLLGEWNLMQSQLELPFSVNGYVFYSPSILNFSEAERIIIAGIGFNYYMTTTACIGLRGEYSKIFINDENGKDKENNLNWENSIIMLGISISF